MSASVSLNPMIRPLPRMRSLELALVVAACLIPWLVLSVPSLVASALAVFLLLRSQGKLTWRSVRMTFEDTICWLIFAGGGAWFISLHLYAGA